MTADGRRRAILLGAAAVWFALCAAAFFAMPTLVDRAVNRVHGASDGVSRQATTLHGQLLIADLHADSLLWPRDLTARGRRGHVDLERLAEGHVAVQVFGLVTKIPLIPSLERNDDRGDLIALLAASSRWPRPTWTDLTERALFQARRLERLANASAGRVVLVRRRGDLEGVLAARARGEPVLAALLAIEGAHALAGEIENLDRLFDAGVRMLSPSHFFDTRMGGSAHGQEKSGLTAFGREVVRRMEHLGMTVDLAHASADTIDDVLSIATRPVVVSHTGLRGNCEGTRNLEDRHARAIAEGGGVLGIGFWHTAVCGRDARAVARAMRYAVDLVGSRHVALGSDFDGAVATPFDAAGLPVLTDALLADGFSHEEIAAVMGENVVRVLSANLPD